jgi:oligopeptide transport system substrate-binding protein
MKRKPTSQAGSLLAVMGLLLLVVGNPAQIEAAAVKDQRVLRLARPTDPQTLDWARVTMMADWNLMPLLNLSLLDVVDGTRLTNWATRDWMSSTDQRSFTFRLRPELMFSNGRPVVAADYAYTLERMLEPRTASPYYVYLIGIRGATQFAQARSQEQEKRERPKPGDPPHAGHWKEPVHVAGIRVLSSDMLQIELEQPDPTFPYTMVQGAPAQPQEEVERLGSRFSLYPVGSGPYVVAEWIRGVRLAFVPNPHYAGGEPRHFDRIEIMIGGDSSTHLMMFERGELEIADVETFVLPLPDHRRITQHSRWRSCVEQSRAAYASWIALNNEIPPLDNPRVRQAFNYAVDKPRRLRSANGRWEPATGILPPFLPGFNPVLKGYGYDPAKARALLAESDVPQPIRLTLWHGLDLDSVLIAQGLQSDLKAIGVEVDLKAVTTSELFAATAIRKKVPMALTGWISAFPDPKDMLSSQFDGRTITNTPTLNLAFYNNPKVNQLLDEAATNVIWSTRYALYQRIEEMIVHDAPVLFLGHPKFFALKQPWVKGHLIEPLWGFRLDRVWIER